MNDPHGSGNPMARQTGLVVQEMADEVLVYDLETDKAHCLNRSAAFVWKCCDGKTAIGDIVTQFESNGACKVTEDFIWLAIDQLNENGLLANKIAPIFHDRSRRQVLKTIGMASAVALPIVASLVAPKRALGVANCSCSSNAQCSQPQNANCPSTTNCNTLGFCAPNTASRKN